MTVFDLIKAVNLDTIDRNCIVGEFVRKLYNIREANDPALNDSTLDLIAARMRDPLPVIFRPDISDRMDCMSLVAEAEMNNSIVIDLRPDKARDADSVEYTRAAARRL